MCREKKIYFINCGVKLLKVFLCEIKRIKNHSSISNIVKRRVWVHPNPTHQFSLMSNSYDFHWFHYQPQTEAAMKSFLLLWKCIAAVAVSIDEHLNRRTFSSSVDKNKTSFNSNFLYHDFHNAIWIIALCLSGFFWNLLLFTFVHMMIKKEEFTTLLNRKKLWKS